jgi:hypothetical protein
VANVLAKGDELWVNLVDRHSHQTASIHSVSEIDTSTNWGVQKTGTARIKSLAVSSWYVLLMFCLFVGWLLIDCWFDCWFDCCWFDWFHVGLVFLLVVGVWWCCSRGK